MKFKPSPLNLSLPLGQVPAQVGQAVRGAAQGAGSQVAGVAGALPLLATQATDTTKAAAANMRAVMWRIWGARVGRAMVLASVGALAYGAYVYRAPLGGFVEQKIAEATGAKVARVVVEGVRYTDKDALQGALQLNRGDSLVSFNAAAARARLEALPWVRLAAVQRELPGTVRIDVYEHVPLARVDVNGEIWVINKDGEPIEPETPQFASLPLLGGAGAAQAAAGLFAVLGTWPNLAGQLARADYVGSRRWDLHFTSGVVVKLPEDGATAALQTLAQLERARNVLALNAGEVDLRLENRIFLKLPAEAYAGPVVRAPAGASAPVSPEPLTSTPQAQG